MTFPPGVPMSLIHKVLKANQLIAEGGTVWFKFTCEQCKARQTFERPNVFYTKGRCEECSHVTDTLTEAADVNFLCMFDLRKGPS